MVQAAAARKAQGASDMAQGGGVDAAALDAAWAWLLRSSEQGL